MKTSTFLVLTVVVIGLFVAVKSSRSNSVRGDSVSQETQSVSGEVASLEDASNLTPQTKQFGAVDMEVEPIQLKANEEVIFNLKLNTHSVELDFDFTTIASLTDDQGNNYQATSWNGGAEGHHLSGELIFPSLKSETSQIILKVNSIDNQSGEFSWPVQS